MDINDKIINSGFDDVLVFDNPSYRSAFLGVSHDNRAVYDYDLMIEFLMQTENWTAEEAIDWIEYNVIRALPYYPNSPIIVYSVEE